MVLGDVCPGVCDEIHAAFCHPHSRDVTLLGCIWQWSPSRCLSGLRKKGGDSCAPGNVEGYREWQKSPVVGLLVRACLPWSLTSVSLP